MQSITNKVLIDQWEISCKELELEFNLKSDDLPSIHSIKSFFLEIVDGKTLSQDAVNALMYGLYFYGYLCALENLKKVDPEFELPNNLHSHPVLEAADKWAQKATDFDQLNQIAQPIVKITQDVLVKLH
jgi:hypothetical protein